MTIDNEEIAIIMPAWNAERTIRSSIESVIQQTYQNWKLIIINDASTDRTVSVIQKYLCQDKRIILISNAKNSGVAFSRNQGLSIIKDEKWVAFLDSDDLWHTEKLRIQMTFMKNNISDFTFTSYWRITEDGCLSSRPVKIPSDLTYKQFLGNTAIATSTVMLKINKDLPKLNQGFSYEDFSYWCSILSGRDDYARWSYTLGIGVRASGIPIPLMAYRICNNSVSRKRFLMSRWVWHILRTQEKLSFLYSVIKYVEYGARALIKHTKYRPRFSGISMLPLELYLLATASDRISDSHL